MQRDDGTSAMPRRVATQSAMVRGPDAGGEEGRCRPRMMMMIIIIIMMTVTRSRQTRDRMQGTQELTGTQEIAGSTYSYGGEVDSMAMRTGRGGLGRSTCRDCSLWSPRPRRPRSHSRSSTHCSLPLPSACAVFPILARRAVGMALWPQGTRATRSGSRARSRGFGGVAVVVLSRW